MLNAAGFVNGRGNHGRGFALEAGRHRDFDGFGNGGGIAGIRFARLCRDLGIGGDQGLFVRGKDFGIADQFERMPSNLAAEMIESRDRDFRTDAGRFTHGDEDRLSSALTG